MIVDTIENGKAVTIEVVDTGRREGAPAPLVASARRGGWPNKERGKFHGHDLVRHETHGICRVIEEWGMWRSCRMCYKPCDGKTCDRCGAWTYEVTGSGIYDVVCPDGKTRSIHQRWLIQFFPVPVLADSQTEVAPCGNSQGRGVRLGSTGEARESTKPKGEQASQEDNSRGGETNLSGGVESRHAMSDRHGTGSDNPAVGQADGEEGGTAAKNDKFTSGISGHSGSSAPPAQKFEATMTDWLREVHAA